MQSEDPGGGNKCLMYDTHTSFVIDTSPALDLSSQPWLNTFDTLTVNPVNTLFIFVLFPLLFFPKW